MKKVVLAIAAMAAVMSLAACSGDNGSTQTASESTTAVQSEAAQTEEQQDSAGGVSVFTEENGVLTYLDTEHSPFEGAGLKITADKSSKTVSFVKTDLEGNETVEYYTFDYNSNTVEQYYYVSMMGTGFYYTYDLSAGEIVKIEDIDHNDSTQSTKDSGRYDSANDRLKGDVASLEAYFTEQYGISISDIVND
ncbi:MAG: hypothetical protein ACI4JK_13615 [Oscillospiraceae bacterium]